MRAVSRFTVLLLAGGFAVAPAAARAQQAPPADSATPAADAIGPKALENFSLNGTVTREAEQPATPAEKAPRTQAQPPRALATPAPQQSAPASRPAPSPSAAQPTRTASAEPREAPPSVEHVAQPPQQSAPSSSVTVPLPKIDGGTGAPAATAPVPTSDFAPEASTPSLAPTHKFPLLPWLLAALALGAGGGFLFWRNRARESFAGAGSPLADAFAAPSPAAPPRAVPAPAPPAPKAPPRPAGIVSTRLRPWIDIGFQPLRCILDNDRVTVEFELELFNSGSAPARAVLVEGTLFNAGPAQEQQIGSFFANPLGEGERMAVIPPLNRVALKTQVAVPSAQMQAYELGGHQAFVPVIAFNALYNWGGGEGQTSASYLLGRDTKGQRLGPFRADLGPRIFRGLAARLLPTGVRN